MLPMNYKNRRTWHKPDAKRSAAARETWRKRRQADNAFRAKVKAERVTFVLTLANMVTGDLLTFGPFIDKSAAHEFASREYPSWRYNVTELQRP